MSVFAGVTCTGAETGRSSTQQQSDRRLVERATAFFVQHVRLEADAFSADFDSTWQQACFVARSSVQQHGKNFATTGLAAMPIRHNTTVMVFSIVMAKSTVATG